MSAPHDRSPSVGSADFSTVRAPCREATVEKPGVGRSVAPSSAPRPGRPYFKGERC
jgi:hypothetical protein